MSAVPPGATPAPGPGSGPGDPPSETGDGLLPETVAAAMRGLLITGEFGPGERLSEQRLAARFGISRNTLREAFRLLTGQRLLVYQPNRGVFVAAPDEAAVVDVYRVRAVFQGGAVRASVPGHPALRRMRALAEEAEIRRREGSWRAVAGLNLAFHRAMVDLCDSPRLGAAFDVVLAELQLVFGQVEDAPHLHDPFVALNAALVEALERGDGGGALAALERYLARSERAVLAALQQARARSPGRR
jgi:DNA-binding GntR family transcriptional regulator